MLDTKETNMAKEHDQSMMDNLYWWGIPTLFRCPNETMKGKDIALIRSPTRLGMELLKEISIWDHEHLGMYQLWVGATIMSLILIHSKKRKLSILEMCLSSSK